MLGSIRSGPPSKRKRTDPDGDTEPKSDDDITRSTFWFDDGSIILQAKTTQFRVHKSVLSRNSGFFKDMFTVPQPENEPTIEGCPIVHLADEPEDLENIFGILYDNVRAYKSIDKVPLCVIGSMLRFGKKYQFDDLHEEAMQHLRNELPTSLNSWQTTYDDDGRWKDFDYNLVDLINLLAASGIRSLLPVAYYAFFENYNASTVVDGVLRDDKTLAELSSESKINLLVGYEALSRHISHSTAWLGNNETWVCPQTMSCKAGRLSVLVEVVENWHSVPLFCPRAWEDNYSPSSSLCRPCTKKMNENFEVARQEFWDNLPTYFRLPKWADLKDD